MLGANQLFGALTATQESSSEPGRVHCSEASALLLALQAGPFKPNSHPPPRARAIPSFCAVMFLSDQSWLPKT